MTIQRQYVLDLGSRGRLEFLIDDFEVQLTGYDHADDEVRAAWKIEPHEIRELGTIAQEIDKLLPDLDDDE